MRALLPLLLLAACGRLRFDAEPRDGDSESIAVFCGSGSAVLPQLTVAGKSIEYMSFNNASQPVAGVRVALGVGPAVSFATSDPNGNYSITYNTGGVAHPLELEYTLMNYFVTRVFTDTPIARDLVGPNLPLWQLGDGPLWTPANMQAIYTAGGDMLDATRGTLNVAVRDCAGQIVENVVVSVDPPPGKLLYQDVNGAPSTTRTSTIGPFGHALALRAQVGVTTITATGGGRTFVPTTVTVTVGQNTLAIVRAID